MTVLNVDHDQALAIEFGDRVPVVVIDDENSPAGRSTAMNWRPLCLIWWGRWVFLWIGGILC